MDTLKISLVANLAEQLRNNLSFKYPSSKDDFYLSRTNCMGANLQLQNLLDKYNITSELTIITTQEGDSIDAFRGVHIALIIKTGYDFFLIDATPDDRGISGSPIKLCKTKHEHFISEQGRRFRAIVLTNDEISAIKDIMIMRTVKSIDIKKWQTLSKSVSRITSYHVIALNAIFKLTSNKNIFNHIQQIDLPDKIFSQIFHPKITFLNSSYQKAIIQQNKSNFEIEVYPRIHSFSLDLSRYLGYIKHGSLGFSLKNLPIKISAKVSDTKRDNLHGIEDNYDQRIDLDALRHYLHSKVYWSISVQVPSVIKPHTGLGLSTQILGGIYLCCAKSIGISLTRQDLFKLGVGHASTLGLNLLFEPSPIIELGTTANFLGQEIPESSLGKIENFPFDIYLVIPENMSSLSGLEEDKFWDEILPDDPRKSLKISYEIINSLIPAVTSSNLQLFIRALDNIYNSSTKIMEEHIQNKEVQILLSAFRDKFSNAYLSSLGPCFYFFTKKGELVESAINEKPNINYKILKGKL